MLNVKEVSYAAIGGGVNGHGRRAMKKCWVVTRNIGREQIVRKFEGQDAEASARTFAAKNS